MARPKRWAIDPTIEIGLSNAFSWTTRWVGRYEAMTSLKWKFAWVNALTERETSSATAYLGEPERWGAEVTPPLPKIAGHHDVHMMTGSFRELLVDPGPLRFCSACLQQGYISIFHQFAALKRCPIHKTQLFARCACGAETPLFHVRGASFDTPFMCPQCGKPWAGEFDPGKFVRADRTLHRFETAFEPLVDWLRRLKRSPYELWHAGHRLTRVIHVEHVLRDRMAWLLQSIEPLKLDPAMLYSPDTRATLTPLALKPKYQYQFFNWRDDPDVILAFHWVHRRILHHYLKGKKRFFRLYRDRRPVRPDDTIFQVPPGVHPLVHAYWVWRYCLFKYGEMSRLRGDRYDSQEWGRGMKLQELWQGTQLTLVSQMHYLLGSYFEIARMTVEVQARSATLGPPVQRAGPHYDPNRKLPIHDLSLWPFLGNLALVSRLDQPAFPSEQLYYCRVAGDVVEGFRTLSKAPCGPGCYAGYLPRVAPNGDAWRQMMQSAVRIGLDPRPAR
jgi:hypothetical protein